MDLKRLFIKSFTSILSYDLVLYKSVRKYSTMLTRNRRNYVSGNASLVSIWKFLMTENGKLQISCFSYCAAEAARGRKELRHDAAPRSRRSFGTTLNRKEPRWEPRSRGRLRQRDDLVRKKGAAWDSNPAPPVLGRQGPQPQDTSTVTSYMVLTFPIIPL